LRKIIFQVFKKLNLLDKISVHLVEISSVLPIIQAKKLGAENNDNESNVFKNEENIFYRKGITKDGVKVYWYYSIYDVPREFSIFIAHEFFDALPIHKFQVLKSELACMNVHVYAYKHTYIYIHTHTHTILDVHI
jgi:NADH dehydrogenase [ubiquinone] 1 alpha subcomplex assembly factor 7